MKRNEDAVLPFISDMMSDKPITLNIPQQLVLSQWAMTKVMVLEYLSSEKELFHTDEQRFALKDHGLISPYTSIWLARHEGIETFYSRANDADLFAGDGSVLKSYVTTLAYKHMVIQVLSIRADEYVGPPIHIDCNDAYWRHACSSIWPTRPRVFWPRERSIAFNNLDAFHRRCRDENSSTDMG